MQSAPSSGIRELYYGRSNCLESTPEARVGPLTCQIPHPLLDPKGVPGCQLIKLNQTSIIGIIKFGLTLYTFLQDNWIGQYSIQDRRMEHICMCVVYT